MCRVNKGVFSTPLSGLIGKKKYTKCGDQRQGWGEWGGDKNTTDRACMYPEQRSKGCK